MTGTRRTPTPRARHDVFSKTKRSEVMSKIRSTGNKATEVALAKLFRLHGITGWRRQYPTTGKPDLAFPRQKVAVFVDGCFWHGCPKHGTRPKDNSAFWAAKLDANRRRDRRVDRTLRATGWRVVRIWEHALAPEEAARTVGRVRRALVR